MRRGWLAALLCGWCALGRADGMFMGAEMLDERASGKLAVASTEQKGVVIELPQGREALLLQTTYHGPAERFAWIIPVPGKPDRDDVFLAEPAFIDELLKRTAPEVRTRIVAPASVGGAKRATEAPPPSADRGSEGGVQRGVPAVTVHERMHVGEFDATILSATGAEALTNWLRTNGYRVPADSADVLGHYTEKHWHFVAFKMQPQALRARPILDDVDPIGIRFPTRKLVYPLHISRASSRQKTGLLLLVLSRQPIACDQLPEARLPLKTRFGKGTAYATIRRETLDSGSPALVTEFRGPGAMPYPDLYYEKEVWTPREGRDWSVRSLWATRYFTLLDREEMEDLSFGASPNSPAMRLVVERVGRVYVPMPRRVLGTLSDPLSWAIAALLLYLLFGWLAQRGLYWQPARVTTGIVAAVGFGAAFMFAGPVGALLLAVAVPAYFVALALPRSSGEHLPDDGIGLGERLRTALLAAGVGGLGYIVLQVLTPRGRLLYTEFGDTLEELCRGEAGATRSLLAIGVLGAWIALALYQVIRGCRGVGGRWVWIALPGAILTVIIGIALGRQVGPHHWLPVPMPRAGASAADQLMGWSITFSSLLALLALLLVISHLMVGPWIAPREGRRIQPLALAVMFLPLLGVLSFLSRAMAADAGSGGYVATGTHQLDRALLTIDALMSQFHDRYGCYPATLNDLVAPTPPTNGADSSGNRVAIATEGGSEGRLAAGELPIDPLTGRRDTWVYEPTGTPMVDSGGYEVELSQVDATEPREAETSRGGYDPEEAARQKKGRYWTTAFEPGPPYYPNRDDHFGTLAPPRWNMVFSRYVQGPKASYFILADPASGYAATVLASNVARLAFAPDNRRCAFTPESGDRSWLFVGQVSPPRPPRCVALRPFAGPVLDLAWSPKDDRWAAAIGQSQGTLPLASLLAIDRAGQVRQVGEKAHYVAVEYAPDGRSLLSVATDAPAGALGEGQGELRRIPLDGRVPETLATDVAGRPFCSTARGCLAVQAPGGMATAIILVRADGTVRRVALPRKRRVAVDAGLTPNEAVLALADLSSDIGEVWAYSLAKGRWHIVCEWRAASRRGTVADALAANDVVILGRDARSGACLVAYGEDKYDVFAVREAKGQERVERLAQSPREEIPAGGEVTIASLEPAQSKARISARVWPNAFRPGDLVAENPRRHATLEPEYVTSCDNHRLRMSYRSVEREHEFIRTDPIRLEPRMGERFLVKLYLVSPRPPNP